MLRIVILGVGLAMATQSSAETNKDQLVVRNGDNLTVITQSGSSDGVESHIETAPGVTTIYRKSGGNTSIVTQRSVPSNAELDSLPPQFRDLFRTK